MIVISKVLFIFLIFLLRESFLIIVIFCGLILGFICLDDFNIEIVIGRLKDEFFFLVFVGVRFIIIFLVGKLKLLFFIVIFIFFLVFLIVILGRLIILKFGRLFDMFVLIVII